MIVTFPQPGGGELRAVDGFDLRVEKGEFVTIVGPSGCGKSTLLSIVDGLVRPSSSLVITNLQGLLKPFPAPQDLRDAFLELEAGRSCGRD